MINYSVSMMVNPLKPEEAPKAYAHAQVTEIYDLNHFAKYVHEHNCKYDEEDVMAILIAVSRRIRECLLNGRKVRLSHLGDFWLTLSSEGAKSKDSFYDDNIKSVNVRFYPGSYLQDLREDAQFEKVATRRAQNATFAAEMAGQEQANWSEGRSVPDWQNVNRGASELLPDA